MTTTTTPPPLLTRADVADLLEVDLGELARWTFVLRDEQRYRRFEIAKRAGGVREIAAPLRPLKDLQRRLAGHLQGWYSPSSHVTGYVLGRGPKPNAEPHRRQEWVLRVDLADFFPSIHLGRVRGMFTAKPFSFGRDAAAVLAQLCCFRRTLPQGAPTSPVISNIICRSMDREIAKLAASERCYFTRYADDLTFSTDRTSFPTSLAYVEGTRATIGSNLERVINGASFTVNEEKTRLVRRWQRQRVTGFVINDRLNLPREYVREVRTLLHIWKRYGLVDAEASFVRAAESVNRQVERIDFQASIRSRIQRVGDTKGWTDPVYRQLVDLLTPLDPDFTPIYERRQINAPTNRRKAVSLQLRVCTEGPTDAAHLTAAMRYFTSQGEFVKLELLLDEDSVYDGDAALAKHLAAIARAGPSVPTVCLFDRDNPKLLRELRLHEQDVVGSGRNVAGAALVRPPFRKQPFCIELLYSDADLLARDPAGRRIYRREEFNLKTGHHNSEQCSDFYIKDRKIIRDQVYAFGSDRNLALSKSSFADLIESRSAPFIPDFAGFRPTIAMLMRLAETFAQTVDDDPRQIRTAPAVNQTGSVPVSARFRGSRGRSEHIRDVPIFASRSDARDAVKAILDRNETVFRLTGPNPRDGSLPSTEAAAQWRDRVLEDIIPGNELIVAIVELNPDLTTGADREAAEQLRLHTEGLIRKHRYGEIIAPVPRFPQGVIDIFAGDP